MWSQRSRTSRIRVLGLGGSRLEKSLRAPKLETGLGGSRPEAFSGFEVGGL
jgi:hypothetical protein